MEDRKTLIADCIVVSCCCQCLILQVIVFLLKLPRKIARKTKEYARRKLRNRRKKKRNDLGEAQSHYDEVHKGDDFIEWDSNMRIVELEEMGVNKWEHHCMDEVEMVMDELSMKGKFGFGSFWGRNNNNCERLKDYCFDSDCVMTKEHDIEFGSHVVKFHLIEVIGFGHFS